MADGKRPGGLTALAVLNFVFAGLLAVLALLAVAGLGLQRAAMEEAARKGVAFDGQGVTTIYIGVAVLVLSTAMLIASGVGYLGQKRVLGRVVGSVYAVLSIGAVMIEVIALDVGLGLDTIIGLVYPALTLLLVNTTFRQDLTG